MKLQLFTAVFVLLASANPIPARNDSSNECSDYQPFVIAVTNSSVVFLYNGTLVNSRDDARMRCFCDFGAQLAAVNSSNVEDYSQILSEPVWVASWNTDSYNDACLLLEGTSITANDCSLKRGAICELNLRDDCPS